MDPVLRAALDAEDLDRVTDWLVNASAAERRALREEVWGGTTALERRTRRLLVPGFRAQSVVQLAVGRWGDLKRQRWPDGPKSAGAALRVLRALRPSWLSKWVRERCEDDFGLDWRLLRPLVLEGLAERPPMNRYLRSLAWFIETNATDAVLAFLQADPHGLDDFWKMFEIDFGGFAPLGDRAFVFVGETRKSRGALPLARALIERGLVPPERMVAAPLHALGAGVDRKAVAGFVELHEGLEPTLEHRVSFQPQYLALLRSPDGPTVGFALAALAKLERAGRLDDAGFADAAGRVFHLRPMNHPKAALALLAKVADRHPGAVRGALLAAREHPAPQVRDMALALLGTSADVPAEIPAAHMTEPPDLDDADPALLAAAGVEAVRSGRIEPVRFGPFDVPRLDRRAVVTPIADVDELCDRISVGLERSDAMEFERILDGIGRLGPTIDPARLRPFLARAEKAEMFTLLGREVGRLVAAALGASMSPTHYRIPIQDRIDEVLVALRQRRPAPRIALPSDPRGWLDPAVWAQRLVSGPLDEHDRIAALYRLAPEGRAEVLPRLDDPRLAPERYAAGGPPPGAAFGAKLLLAAARARDPLGDVSDIVRVDGAAGSAAMVHSLELRAVGYGPPLLTVVTEPTHTRSRPSLVRGTSHAPDGPDMFWLFADVGHEVLTWPANPRPFLAMGVPRLDSRRDTTSNTFSPVAPYVAPLFDPDVPWDDEGLSLPLVVAAMALTSLDPDARARALDATIAAVADGRCAGGGLGRTFALLLDLGRLKLNRVASALMEIARTSALAQWICGDIGSALLLAVPSPPPKDLHHLLEALHEILVASRRPVDPEAVPLLSPLVGSSKTGKLAKRLLEHRGSPDVPPAVRAESLAGRIKRVERWAGR